MDCNENRRLIDADVDGELDLVRHLEIATHLRGCPGCTQYAENVRARRSVLNKSLTRFRAPPELAGKISAVLRTAETPVAPTISSKRKSVASWPMWHFAGLAASVALGLFIGFGWGGANAKRNFLVDAAVEAHVRSLQVNHLTDVVSSDQHTVKPWFVGKLDFSPPVVDLASSGFPLSGGRMERIDEHPAAALVFHRRQHAINLFIWPGDGSTGESHRSVRNGYHVLSWAHSGFNFLAISEIPPEELEKFAMSYRTAIP
jgi:anti-sigma factor RsiW